MTDKRYKTWDVIVEVIYIAARHAWFTGEKERMN
jgi:hypothetical protein